jgi:hypothetical protein
MAIDENNALVVELPEPKGEDWEEPKLEGEELEKLVDLFRRATRYAEAPSALRDPTARFEVNADPSDRVLLEGMRPAVAGEVPTIFIAQSERELKTLFMFLDSFPAVRPVVGGGAQAFHVADELARRGIPVIVGTMLTPSRYRTDPVTSPWRNAAILADRGVTVAFTTSFSPEGASEVRNLPYTAARAVAYGMDRDAAFAGITSAAASVLGLGEELGTLTPGKRADVIVTTGDPLQIMSHVERMWIGGDEMPLVSKHTRLYQQFMQRGQGGVVTEEAGGPVSLK